MLESLNSQAAGQSRLVVEIVGRPRYVDQRDFALYLVDPLCGRSPTPVFRGRYNAGRPTSHVPAWIDGEFGVIRQDQFEQGRAPGGPAGEVARWLGTLIPAGGRLWFAYESLGEDSWLQSETRAAFAARVPAEVTPIGLLLVQAGCWSGMRDWDFPEGGWEGFRKVQGNKPLNKEHACQSALALVRALRSFAAQRGGDAVTRRAQARAALVRQELEQIAGRDLAGLIGSSSYDEEERGPWPRTQEMRHRRR
jgi:hypothetical protein